MLLAGGIVALEFAAAVTRFVASTLLPTVARDLDARDQLGLLVTGSTLGLFVALPLATRVVRRLGSRGTLTTGMVAYLGGAAVAATSGTAWQFALGQFAAGLAGGLLASAMAAARSTPTSTRRSCGPWRWRNSSPPTCSEGGDASTKVATPIGWEVER